MIKPYFAENCGQLLNISTLYFEGPQSEMKAFCKYIMSYNNLKFLHYAEALLCNFYLVLRSKQ
jgi:hypothetical protein